MDLLIAGLVVYGALVLLLVLYRGLALARLRQAFISGDDRLGVSLAWAWAASKDLAALAYTHGEQRLGPIFLEPSLRVARLINPLIAIPVAAILFYQWVLRGQRGFATGDCPTVPNCSNYAIGALLRFGLIQGGAKTVIRLRHCDGAHGGISFHERHL